MGTKLLGGSQEKLFLLAFRGLQNVVQIFDKHPLVNMKTR
jgi:hypothetical protein